jgi:2-polyprenyl-6-methoxyphenol hydroxylase-like FAD-dependent oxidoreductase
MTPVDVQIRGSGAVASALALALGPLGLHVALSPARSSSPNGPDVRTYALNAASRELLERLRVWQALPADAVTPVYDMRVRGDAAGALLEFSAWEQCVEALAWIVDAAALDAALADALQFATHVQRRDGRTGVGLTVLAEGKDSDARSAYGVSFHRQAYGQRAVAARLTSERVHDGVACQWFRAPDVLALLPFDRPQAGRSYGLVWSLPEARARELLALDAGSFEAELQRASEGQCGRLQLAGPRAAWPLAIAIADRVCGPGWVLVGDAAHVVHPLAGQGLNLGLADVATLAAVLAAREPWRSVGDERLLRRFARKRAGPTRAMARLTDGLLHTFAHSQPLLRELRNHGLTLLNHAPAAKRWMVWQALGR